MHACPHEYTGYMQIIRTCKKTGRRRYKFESISTSNKIYPKHKWLRSIFSPFEKQVQKKAQCHGCDHGVIMSFRTCLIVIRGKFIMMDTNMTWQKSDNLVCQNDRQQKRLLPVCLFASNSLASKFGFHLQTLCSPKLSMVAASSTLKILL